MVRVPVGDGSPCNVCGAKGAPVTSFERDGRPFVVRRCVQCGHRYLDGWEGVYDVALYDYYRDRVGLPRDALFDPLTIERLSTTLHRFRGDRVGLRLLDIGCGEGQLLEAAARAGYDSLGVDVAPAAVEICRSFGLRAELVDVHDARLDDERFDVVTLVETIEHVPSPMAMLARARDLLNAGGVVWLTTPNFRSLGHRVLGADWPPLSPEHLSYLTPESLRTLARRAGFSKVRVRSRTLSAAALRRLARRREIPSTAVSVGTHVSAPFAAEQQLRHRLEGAAPLRLAKDVANQVLSALGVGETLTAELRA